MLAAMPDFERDRGPDAAPGTARDATVPAVAAPHVGGFDALAAGGGPAGGGLGVARVLALQQTSGNQAVARMLAGGGMLQPSRPTLQRDWRDYIPSLPGLGDEKKPVEKNWDMPATGAEDLTPGWNETPAFPRGYSAHEATPELDTGKQAFQRDWTTLTQSWNTSAQIAQRSNIKAKLPDSYVAEIDGKAVPPPPKQLVPDAENARPSGKQDFSVGSIFGADNKLEMKTPFDPNQLKGADRDDYDKKIADTTKARNDRDKANVTVDDKLVGVRDAFSKLRQAQIKERQADMGAEQKEAGKQKVILATEQAQVEAIVKGAEAVFTAGVKREPGAAAGAAVGTMVAVYYQDKVGAIEAKIAELDVAIAQLQKSYEMESVVQAKNAIVTATNAVKTALLDLNTALSAEKAAFNNLALTIEKLAKKLGLDAESARTARSAAAALPLIEETLGNLSQLEASAIIPSYSTESGIGAGLVTNLVAFQQHLAMLKGFRTQVGVAKVQWTQRRTAAQQGVGVPAQTTL
jgi:hypothetical protein